MRAVRAEAEPGHEEGHAGDEDDGQQDGAEPAAQDRDAAVPGAVRNPSGAAPTTSS